MNLQKRNCPVEIRVLPGGAGWTDVEWFVPAAMAEPLLLPISYIGNLFGAFVGALYQLYPEHYEEGKWSNLIDYKFAQRDPDTNEICGLYDDRSAMPGNTFWEIPYKAAFAWSDEPGGSVWEITREPTDNTEFVVELDLSIYEDDEEGGEKTVYHYQFEYRDLCYAVSKAMTDVLKAYGVYGYSYSTGEFNFDLNQLLFIKSIALDCMEARELQQRGKYDAATDFDKEIQLLLFDM